MDASSVYYIAKARSACQVEAPISLRRDILPDDRETCTILHWRDTHMLQMWFSARFFLQLPRAGLVAGLLRFFASEVVHERPEPTLAVELCCYLVLCGKLRCHYLGPPLLQF